MKTCTICELSKPLTEFYKNPSQPCKKCHIERTEAYRLANPEVELRTRMKRNYGITPEQHQELVKSQRGVCAICKRPETAVKPKREGTKALAVDHCRDTMQVRGLLCQKCNTGIGNLDHSVERLEAAAQYLRDTLETSK